MMLTTKHLRRQALAGSLFRPATLARAIQRLGFVQADPIRAPARAQDLILRHRVRGYQAGDLEAQYSELDIEEDFLYAYGFMPQSTWLLLHPRSNRKLSAMERQIVEVVSSHQQVHPRQLDAHLGSQRELNAWGGYSKATTRSLERLHYRGVLRIAGRQKGVRLYEAMGRTWEPIDIEERLRRLVLLIAQILAPLPEKSLQETMRFLRHAAPMLEDRSKAVKKLLASGDLTSGSVDDIRYVWPTEWAPPESVPEKVRFLAPFDPLVWDRRRFEHFWQWRYRFEAYTPVEKRKLGYYAMPMLWRDKIIGWANISNPAGKPLLEIGFVDKEVKDAAFRRELDAEWSRFQSFLKVTKQPVN